MNPDEPSLSAKDIQTVAGLTYRQLNDWDARGAIPNSRQEDRSWRRFSARDAFAIMVMAEIRRRFGTPVSRLAFVRQMMLGDGANHFENAITLMMRLGMNAVIVTDLEGTFILETDREVAALLSAGLLSPDDPSGYVVLGLGPIVNSLMGLLGADPIELSGRGSKALDAAAALSKANTLMELNLLLTVRDSDVDEVQVILCNGAIETIRRTTHPSPNDLLAAVAEFDYQKLTVVKRNGEVVSITREITDRGPHHA